MVKRAKLGARSRALLVGALVAATGLIAQVPAHAAPPPPTVVLNDGGDGWVNIAEAGAVILTGTYDTTAVPAITQINARIVNSAICDTGAPGTPNQIFAVNGDGTFTSPPFDVSGFPNGAVLCGRARTIDSSNAVSASAGLSNTSVLDKVAPAATISLLDGDGKVDNTEATGGVPVSWEVTEAGPAVTVKAFNLASPASANCTYAGQPRGPVVGAITPPCFNDMVEGIIAVTVEGTDLAGNPASAIDGSILDRLLPAPGVVISPTLITAANQTAVSVTVTGNPDEAGSLTFDDTNAMTPALNAAINLAAGPALVVFDVTSLSDGTLTATANVTDAAGNVGSGNATATKDATPPGAPIIVTPIENQVVPGSFTISGTAEASSTVTVWDITAGPPSDSNKLGTTVANAQNAWQVPVVFTGQSTTLLQAQAVDTVGNVSPLSAIRTIDVDSIRPSVTIESPANNSLYLPGDQLQIEGIAQDEGKGVLAIEVHVFQFGLEVASTQIKNFTCVLGCPVNKKVKWTYKPNVGSGYFTAKFWAIDVAGNRTAQPQEVSFFKLG